MTRTPDLAVARPQRPDRDRVSEIRVFLAELVWSVDLCAERLVDRIEYASR